MKGTVLIAGKNKTITSKDKVKVFPLLKTIPMKN